MPANPEPPQIPDGRQDHSNDDLGPDRPGRPWSLLILAIVVVWLGLERLHDDRELAVELLLVGAFLTALVILPADLRKLVSRYWPFWRD